MIECGDMTTSRKGMSGSSNPSSVALLVMASFVSFMLAPLEGTEPGEGRRKPSEEGIPSPLPRFPSSHLPKAFITAPSPASYAATGRMEIFILQRETPAAFPPHRSKVFGGIGGAGEGEPF